MTYNLKAFGYEMARRLLQERSPPAVTQPQVVGLGSKACTQADLDSGWAAHWCAELKIPLFYHRKLWEYAYVLQALHEHDVLRTGARGLGFGCGQEPIPSYLVGRGLVVTITDLAPDEAQRAGWVDTRQHAGDIERLCMEHLTTREAFRERATLRFVDMNDVPEDLGGYDFCWSICALEHLGSIEQGLMFMERAMRTLRPGGIAVHTTEFNFLNEEATLDNAPTVLPQRRHFRDLASRLEAAGHWVAPLDFDVGAQPMDRFIDMPPYPHDWPEALRGIWGNDASHLKLAIDGHASTCFGLIAKRG